jgi:peptidyl-prolyl cis-trans isomerase SurA
MANRLSTPRCVKPVQAQEHFIRMQIADVKDAEAKILTIRATALFSLMERQLVLSDFEQSRGALNPQYVEDDINHVIREQFAGDRAKFLRELSKAGMTIQGFREQRRKALVFSHLTRQKIKDLPPPSPAQVEAYYRDHAEMFREKDFVQFSTITIPKYPGNDAGATPESQKKLAEDIRTQIKAGAAFAKLAAAHSTDAHAREGGDRGLQERTALGKEIADVAFSLKPGSISGVLDIETSYMIIFCEARQPGKQVPLEQVRPQIERLVSAAIGRQAVNQWLSGLARKAIIKPSSIRNDFLKWLDQQHPLVE